MLAGVDSIEHCNQLTPATAREMVARGTFRSPTICAIRGILDHADRVPDYAVEKARQIEADSKKSHRTAIRAGVRPVCGTDAGTPFNPHGSAPQEIVFMVEWGMPPLDALRAATANGAELLRLHDVGTIEAGKRADLLLVDGDPVEDPSDVARSEARVAGRPVPSSDRRRIRSRTSTPSPRAASSVGERVASVRLQGLDPSRATPPERPGTGRRRADPHRPRVIRIGLTHREPVPHQPVDQPRSSWAARPARSRASSPIRFGPANTRTERRERRGAEMPSASSSTRRRRKRWIAAEWSRSATRPTSRVGEVRLDVVIGISLGYLNINGRAHHGKHL